MSGVYYGHGHDYSILKAEFPCEKDWFKEFCVHIDLGFLGFEKDYKFSKVLIPKKKKKNMELSEEDKEGNKEKSSVRVAVEQSLSQLKRFRVLSDRVRAKDWAGYDAVAFVCAGLANYILKHSKP